MKSAWQAAKKLQEQSGFGVREDDCTRSINEVLNKKCKFFWRLDEIFGTRPNNVPVTSSDSLPPPQPRLPSQSQPQTQPQTPLDSPEWDVFDPDILAPDEWPESDQEQQNPRASTEEEREPVDSANGGPSSPLEISTTSVPTA
ncbi:hypothetical protein V8E54_006145, partial [Elaphomyces granulatus]